MTTHDNKSTLNLPTNTGGVAYLHVGGYRVPLKGTIAVYDHNGDLFASTNQSISLSGGDIYSAVSVSPIKKWLLNQ